MCKPEPLTGKYEVERDEYGRHTLRSLDARPNFTVRTPPGTCPFCFYMMEGVPDLRVSVEFGEESEGEETEQ